jgi:hypothetical protein
MQPFQFGIQLLLNHDIVVRIIVEHQAQCFGWRLPDHHRKDRSRSFWQLLCSETTSLLDRIIIPTFYHC